MLCPCDHSLREQCHVDDSTRPWTRQHAAHLHLTRLLGECTTTEVSSSRPVQSHAIAMFAICNGSVAWWLLLLPALLVLALVAAVVVIQAGNTAATTALATTASCLHTSSAHQDVSMHDSNVSVKIRHRHGALLFIAQASSDSVFVSTQKGTGM